MKAKRVGLYARVSTSNGQDPEVQLRELRQFCERRGFQIVEEFVDKGIRRVAQPFDPVLTSCFETVGAPSLRFLQGRVRCGRPDREHQRSAAERHLVSIRCSWQPHVRLRMTCTTKLSLPTMPVTG